MHPKNLSALRYGSWILKDNQKFGGISLLNSIESLQSSHMPSGFVVSFIPQIFINKWRYGIWII